MKCSMKFSKPELTVTFEEHSSNCGTNFNLQSCDIVCDGLIKMAHCICVCVCNKKQGMHPM